MLAKIYWLTWLAIALAAALILVTGNMTTFWIVVFGFVAFGMVFMGMMAVLPASIAHPPTPAKAEPETSRTFTEPVVRTSIQPGARSVRV
jgi:hypothetical protein